MEYNILSPFADYRVTDTYGMREKHPILGDRRMHKGVDLVSKGDPNIRAGAAGVIEQVRDPSITGGYGYSVILRTPEGYALRYNHLRPDDLPGVGQEVQRGDFIGVMGDTGRVTGAHLDMNLITPEGEYVDVLPFLNSGDTPVAPVAQAPVPAPVAQAPQESQPYVAQAPASGVENESYEGEGIGSFQELLPLVLLASAVMGGVARMEDGGAVSSPPRPVPRPARLTPTPAERDALRERRAYEVANPALTGNVERMYADPMQYGLGDLEMVASLYSNDPNDYLSRYGTDPNNIFFGRLPNYAIKGFEDPKLFGRTILQNVALPGYEGGNIVLATPEQKGVEGYDDGILRHETRHIGIRDIMNHPRFAEYAEQLLGPEEKENLMYFQDYLLSGPYTEVKERSEEYLGVL